MSNNASPPEYGPALHRYLEGFWEAEGLSMSAWAIKYGLPPVQISRWGTGQGVGLDSLRRVADAISRPLPDVLLAIGLILPAEMDGREPELPHRLLLSDLIDQADDLSDAERGAVHEAVDLMLRAMRGGKGGHVSVKN